MHHLYDEAIDRLAQAGWAIVDGFLSPTEVKVLLTRFQLLESDGKFFKAGIGKMHRHTVDSAVRGDYIHWLGDGDGGSPEAVLEERCRDLMAYINRTCFLGLRDLEMHMAHYPAGTRYQRHRDRFAHNPHRILSLVMYLNEGWQTSDGGELVIVDDAGCEYTIQPVAGRLALFRSELEHEVLLTHTSRYSITGWMLDQVVGLTFL